MFKPGESGNPNGRPKGSLNKATVNYLDFQIWFQQVKEDLEKLKPEERIEVCLRVIEKLMSKVQNLPGTPGDSLDNARRTQEMLSGLEKKENEPVA